MIFSDEVKITPLGAGCEVGRSCLVLKYNTRTIMLDCGVHPAHVGVASLPFLDLVDLESIDALFITHFHLDHAAALPFLTEKTKFKGKVYMTHPTKAILRWLLNDYIRIINSASDADFYSEADLLSCFNKIIPVDYHQVVNVSGIKVTALNAGHVLGAAMFLTEVEKSSILYTGDFSREEDRHLRAAETPNKRVDALITEATYGLQCHLPRAERENRFTSTVQNIVSKGGRCLLPVFALGRAQELLLILEEHWEANKHLQGIPIYYASALAKKCMNVYRTYINMMNERIQKLSLTKNPFEFKYVKNLNGIEHFRDDKPCVIMASPGMLQSGLSRELFERWCSNPRNGVIIAGYCVEGTLAKEIQSEPKEIVSLKGLHLKLNMSVEFISFSAHVDFTQNSQFIDECQPSYLFFVHGENNEMQRLKGAIASRNEKIGREMQIYTLKNGEEGGFRVSKESTVKIYSREGEIDGILVSTAEEVQVFDGNSLQNSKFQEIGITHKQHIPYNSTFMLLKKVLNENFDDIREESVKEEDYVNAEDCVGLEAHVDVKDNAYAENIVGTEVDAVRDKNIDDGDTERKSKCVKSSRALDRNNINKDDGEKDYNTNRNDTARGVDKNRFTCLRIGGIKLWAENNEILMEWEGGHVNDVLALTINKLIADIGTKVTNVKLSTLKKEDALKRMLRCYYEIEDGQDEIIVRHSNMVVYIRGFDVQGDEELAEKVEGLIDRVRMIYTC